MNTHDDIDMPMIGSKYMIYSTHWYNYQRIFPFFWRAAFRLKIDNIKEKLNKRSQMDINSRFIEK